MQQLTISSHTHKDKRGTKQIRIKTKSKSKSKKSRRGSKSPHTPTDNGNNISYMAVSKRRIPTKHKIRIPKEKLIVKNKSKSKKRIFNNLRIVSSGHDDSLLNLDTNNSPKVVSRKSSKLIQSPQPSTHERRAIVSHFNSPKNNKFVVSISSTANTSVKTKSKYMFNAFSRKRIKEIK